MRRLAALTSLLLAACANEIDAPVGSDRAGEIDDYVRSLPLLPTQEPQVIEAGGTGPTQDGDYQCVTQNLSETRQYDKIVAYAANSDGLWPGALVGGGSVYDGLFTQVALPRAPATISVSLENLAGSKSATMASPSLSSFRDAVSQIVAQEVTGATPANIYSELEQVHSEEQLALALGAEVSWLGSSASIAASFDFSQQDVRSRYLVKYTQAYYTVDLDAPGRPSDVFAPEVTVDALAEVIGPENPPLYVSSVTYGRMVVFTFESEYSAEELNAGGDAGDDLELYGSIWAQAGSRLTLMNKDEANQVTIAQGESWPNGGFIAEGILRVSPQAGSAITLGANLMDQDGFLNANDAIGNEQVVAPFELGWRRDVTLYLTGDGSRVLVTIGLQPI